MFRSLFLRKMVFLVLVALCASALLSATLFNYAAGEVSKDNTEEIMIDKARSMASFLGSYADQDKTLSDSEITGKLKSISAGYASRDVLGTFFLLYDANGSLISSSNPQTSEDLRLLSAIDIFCTSNMLTNSDNKNLRGELDNDGSNVIMIQFPVQTENKLCGYLIIGDRISSSPAAVTGFSQVLILSTLVVSLFMLIPVYFASKRLIRPLNRVTDVANALGRGDFSIRANDKTKGEIGDLAASVNELAEKLSKSITSVTTERNRLKEIFDIISEGIVSVNKDLQPDYSNNAIATLFEKVPRKNLFTEKLQLIPFEEVWEDFENCIKTGETYERTIEAKDCAYSSTIVPIKDNEKTIIGATGFFRDISEQERLEQTRRDYVANVSHELRTPLTAMRGLVEPLADGMVKKEEDRQRYYGIILHETMRLSRLIDDMLELSRLQARTLAFKTFPFDLNKLLSEFETKFKPVMEDAELNFSVEYKTGPLPTVMGNPDRVEQIIVILLDNAKKFTHDAEARLQHNTNGNFGEKKKVVMKVTSDHDKTVFTIEDTGIGVPPEAAERIFEEFIQLDEYYDGTGIGLTIARSLARRLGGDIHLDTSYTNGARFVMEI